MGAKSCLLIALLVFASHAHAALPDGVPCVRDSNCDNRCYKGYCTSKVGYGGTCDYKWECSGALVCRDRKCMHKGGSKNIGMLKSNGASCYTNDECKNICIGNICKSRVRASGTCNRSDQCYGKLVCRNGKCQKKEGSGKSNGRKCKYNYECANVCLAGTCRNARHFGQSCFRNIHCKEDLVCVSRTCRSPMHIEPPSAPAAIPRPIKRPNPIPPKAPSKPKKMTKQSTSAPAPAPAPAPAAPKKQRATKKKPVTVPAPKKKHRKVMTKEGKTAGAQASIQVTMDTKEKPKSTGLLRSGKGSGAKASKTRSEIIDFFFCMVHKEKCQK